MKKQDYLDLILKNKTIIPRYVIEPMFEGERFRIPQVWESCLKLTYGDYMKLSPEEERADHSI